MTQVKNVSITGEFFDGSLHVVELFDVNSVRPICGALTKSPTLTGLYVLPVHAAPECCAKELRRRELQRDLDAMLPPATARYGSCGRCSYDLRYPRYADGRRLLTCPSCGHIEVQEVES